MKEWSKLLLYVTYFIKNCIIKKSLIYAVHSESKKEKTSDHMFGRWRVIFNILAGVLIDPQGNFLYTLLC